MKSYADSLQTLYDLVRVGEKYSLDGPRGFIERLGNPLLSYDSILVAGTNGKGSTSHVLAKLLESGGSRVGLFTSPHLVSYRERIKINGIEISERAVCELVERVVPVAVREGVSFFETTWAMAAQYFKDQAVDVVVWEVGLGGRLDATNVCDPIGSIVTNIGLDHMAILGHTLAAIAGEKAGVFRPGRPALTADEEALDLLQAKTDARVEWVPTNWDLSHSLTGVHQQRNISVAVRLLTMLNKPFQVSALMDMSIPGRLERVHNLILDCAHNPHAVKTVLSAVHTLQAEDARPLEIVFGAMGDKDVQGMASAISSMRLPVHLVEPSYPRRLELHTLQSHFEHADIASVGTPASFLESRRDDRQYLVLGSAFLVAEIKSLLDRVEYPECGIVTLAR